MDNRDYTRVPLDFARRYLGQGRWTPSSAILQQQVLEEAFRRERARLLAEAAGAPADPGAGSSPEGKGAPRGAGYLHRGRPCFTVTRTVAGSLWAQMDEGERAELKHRLAEETLEEGARRWPGSRLRVRVYRSDTPETRATEVLLWVARVAPLAGPSPEVRTARGTARLEHAARGMR